MHIAVVTTSFPAGADDPAGHFVRAETNALRRDGHAITIVTPSHGGAFGWPGVAARVRQRPLRAVEAAAWVAAARGRVRRTNADRIVAHWAVPCAWPIGVAARGVGLEAVSHGGDVRLVAALPSPARRIIVRTLAARVERWRFVSSALLDELLRAVDGGTRRALERVAVVAPAALEMPDVREAVARRRASLGGRRVAVSVGRLIASKRVDRAIERVAAAPDVDTLVVVGDGPERARLEQFAKARDVDVRFVGVLSRPDALAWIGAADVVLHASEVEGLSTVLREAQALGTPVEIIPLR